MSSHSHTGITRSCGNESTRADPSDSFAERPWSTFEAAPGEMAHSALAQLLPRSRAAGRGRLPAREFALARGNYFPGICSRSRSVYRPNSDRRSRMIPSGTKRGWRCVHANERKIWDELRTWDQARSVRIESLSVCSRLLCRRAAKWLVIFSASVCLIVSVVFRL